MKNIGVFHIRFLAISLLVLFGLFISSCTTGNSTNPITIVISPNSINLGFGGTEQFTATVSGSSNTDVTWTATGGTISNSGLFTADNTAGTFDVKVVSVADSSKSATAVVNITNPTAISISISPTTANLKTGANQQFTATVNGSSNKNVTWSATGGSISNSGLFTAGNTIGNFEVKAVSKVDTSKFAVAAVKVIVEPVIVSINPNKLELYVKNQVQFTASISGTANQGVRWSASAGLISSNGLYTVPNNPVVVTITATSNADNSKTASLTIQVKELEKVWHKLLGSSTYDYVQTLAADKDGNVYLAGYTEGDLFGETNKGGTDTFIVKFDKDGNKIWHRWLGASGSDYVRALAIDNDGNIYLAGYTFGALFGETNKGQADAFIVKFDKDGNEKWHKWFGSDKEDYSYSIAVDNKGNIYLAGNTKGTLFGEPNKGNTDAFIVKFDKDGNEKWHKWFGSSEIETVRNRAIAVDSVYNVYFIAHTRGAFFGETNKGDNDTFIVKYDKDGNEKWHKWFGSNGADVIRSVTTDKQGNIYLSAYTNGAFFDETNKGSIDTFIIKYDKNGNKIWHKWLGSDDGDYTRAIVTDNDNNVYLTAYSYGDLFGETNQGDRDAYAVKYDKDGNKIWHKWLATSSSDIAEAITVDNSGNVYLASYTEGAFFTETNQGKNDIYIVQYKQ